MSEPTILLEKIDEAIALATDPGTIALLESAARHERWLPERPPRKLPCGCTTFPCKDADEECERFSPHPLNNNPDDR